MFISMYTGEIMPRPSKARRRAMELVERKRQKKLQKLENSDAIVVNNTPSELPTAVEADVPNVIFFIFL